VAGKIAHRADKWPEKIQNIVNDVQDNVVKGIEDNNISIKVESNGDTVIITTPDKKNREQTLEDLEKGNSSAHDTLKVKK
jgi:hypothetical protein